MIFKTDVFDNFNFWKALDESLVYEELMDQIFRLNLPSIKLNNCILFLLHFCCWLQLKFCYSTKG